MSWCYLLGPLVIAVAFAKKRKKERLFELVMVAGKESSITMMKLVGKESLIIMR